MCTLKFAKCAARMKVCTNMQQSKWKFAQIIVCYSDCIFVQILILAAYNMQPEPKFAQKYSLNKKHAPICSQNGNLHKYAAWIQFCTYMQPEWQFAHECRLNENLQKFAVRIKMCTNIQSGLDICTNRQISNLMRFKKKKIKCFAVSIDNTFDT